MGNVCVCVSMPTGHRTRTTYESSEHKWRDKKAFLCSLRSRCEKSFEWKAASAQNECDGQQQNPASVAKPEVHHFIVSQ